MSQPGVRKRGNTKDFRQSQEHVQKIKDGRVHGALQELKSTQQASTARGPDLIGIG